MFSGLAPIADMRDGMPDFRLVPLADIAPSSLNQLHQRG
jgi:hypothetical protein